MSVIMNSTAAAGELNVISIVSTGQPAVAGGFFDGFAERDDLFGKYQIAPLKEVTDVLIFYRIEQSTARGGSNHLRQQHGYSVERYSFIAPRLLQCFIGGVFFTQKLLERLLAGFIETAHSPGAGCFPEPFAVVRIAESCTQKAVAPRLFAHVGNKFFQKPARIDLPLQTGQRGVVAEIHFLIFVIARNAVRVAFKPPIRHVQIDIGHQI